MTSRLAVMEAVENLNYRVTIGDVATQAGLDLNLAQRELLSLATETGGHLQVAESGEIAYVFAKEFRNILQARSQRLRIQAWLKNVWKWVFYAIRISFGILLVVSILIVIVVIIAAMVALQSRDSDNDNSDRRGSDRSYGGGGFMPWIWLGNPFDAFRPDYYEPQRSANVAKPAEEMGFLESVFSFLFGDGNPNADLEARRWRAIAAVIRNHNGVVIAEQITPYLDDIGSFPEGYEDYMIPILSKFNGQPQVSDQGTLVYSFPDLQKVATERKKTRVGSYLNEIRWQFSKAGSGKIALSIGLGVFYLILALVLGNLLPQVLARGIPTGFLGLIIGFGNAAFGFLLGYAIAFLTVPAVRYFVIQILNGKLDQRNQKRQARSQLLESSSPQLEEKLAFAHQFATRQEVISADNLAYSTETDLADQEYKKFLKEMDESAES